MGIFNKIMKLFEIQKEEELVYNDIEKTRKIYFEYYGYYEEGKEQFFKNIIDRIREEMNLNKDVEICEAFGFTKMRDSLFTGVSFTLIDSDFTANNPDAGTLSWVTEYKEGKQHGRCINYYPNGNMKTEFIYNVGEEISKRNFDKDGDEEKKNENICYVDREKSDFKNLTIYASMKPEFLDWVVMDMSTRKVVFTSDSNGECEKWISN
jgi:antitoxin component YwqK of YwqJK toxin-antitoxin module